MPDWKSIVQGRIGFLHLEGSAEADLVEELSQHLEDRYRDLRSGGAADEEALRVLTSELDELYPLQAKSARMRQLARRDAVPPGDSKPANVLEDFWRDLRYTARSMRKSPAFVLFVVLTLGLGIGANTTVFTVINTLILNPLPVPNSSELVAINAAKAESTAKSNVPLPLSYADLKDLQTENAVFRTFAGYSSPRGVTWESENTSQGLFVELVTGNYFPALQLSPAKGRFFLPQEDSTPGAHAVVVLNYGTWQTRFGGKPDIIGKTVRLNNIVFTVIGVAPPHFIGVNAMFGPDLWIPAAMAEQVFPTEMHNVFADRGKTFLQGVGRLRPQFTQQQAQANVAAIAANLAREYPATDEGRTAAVRPVRDVLFANSSTSATSLLFASAALLIVVGIVLLIACSNVANLLLARAASRQQEMAIRLAIGANRRRLLRQLLTESVLLGFISGAVGLFIAYAGLRLLFGLQPSSANFVTPKFDITVFLFALFVSLLTALLFGTLPALRASSVDVAETLKEEARTMGRSRSKVTLANALLVGQVAFSFFLLVTAGLFLRSIQRAYAIDPGFQTAHLAMFMTSPGQAGYGKARTNAFYKDVRQRVTRIPEVESVSWASNLPLWTKPVAVSQIEGRQPRSKADKIATIVSTVDRNYFETAGVAIDYGREFTDVDQENSTPVAIVNEKMARDYWPGQGALGKRIQLSGDKQMRQIIGVARNANYTNWAEPPQPCVYIPLEQNYSDSMVLYVHSKGSPQQVMTPIQQELRAAGSQVKISTQTGPQIIKEGLFFVEAGVALLSVFGLLALGLASIGLYGILAYAVNQRKREIGLRMALGAGRTSVVRLIVKEGMSLVGAGVLIGLAEALLIGRFLTKMLYGLSASDPISLAGAAAVMLIIALVACYLPARGASCADPLIALREG
jgi:predicted permease